MMKPENIHCMALNYGGVGETKEFPLYFVKPAFSFCGNGTEVVYPKNTVEMWTEVELGIVVGKDCSNISADEAQDYIEGFTVCGDVTCQNIEGRDHHLAYSKGRANFAPTSSSVVKIDSGKLLSLNLRTEINGRVTQTGKTDQMIFGPLECFSYLSSVVPLKKGDLILTGTPPGHENNMLKAGDQVKHVIEEIGEVNFVVIA